MNDYPTVRQYRCCPVCGTPKSAGLILCWGCHNKQKKAHDGGYSPAVVALLEREEAHEQWRVARGFAPYKRGPEFGS